MTVADTMLKEFLHESQTTKKLLERVPENKLDWKPHEKSMTLGRLATHITEIPLWAEAIVDQDLFDMDAVEFTPTTLGSRAELLDSFEKNVNKFKAVMEGKQDQALFANWRFKWGGEVKFELPKAAVVRSFILSHIVHHRGQLSVYLRENDVPLPAMYGPSADEQS